jgi:hypothetical protein
MIFSIIKIFFPDAWYAFYLWEIYFPQSGALAEGTPRPGYQKFLL